MNDSPLTLYARRQAIRARRLRIIEARIRALVGEWLRAMTPPTNTREGDFEPPLPTLPGELQRAGGRTRGRCSVESRPLRQRRG